jgi:hypothetical protein
VTIISNEIRSVSHHTENVEKQMSTMTGRVQQLGIAPSKADENKGYDGEDDDDTIYGSDGLVDERQTNANRM